MKFFSLKRRFLIMMIAIGCTAHGGAQTIAVNTDAVMDALAAPSLGVEIVMTKKSSLNINAMYGPKFLYQDMKLGAVQPEWRVYLSGRPMYHHYVGGMGLWATYKLRLGSKIYDGDAYGLGVSYGYVLPIGKHWTVDFHTSLGYVFYKQKEYAASEEYTYNNEDGYLTTNSKGSSCFPLRIGVAFSYIIK